MVTIISFVVLMAILLYSLYRIFEILLGMLKMYLRERIACPGADKAYEMLRRNMVDGEVPDEALERAVELMMSDGASDQEVFRFLCGCRLFGSKDVRKMCHAVERSEEKIRAMKEAHDGLNG